jgi:hypothetical protein
VELRSSSVVRCRIRRRLIARKSRFSCKQHAIRIAWLRDSRLGAACIGSHQRAAPASAAKSTAESFGRPTRGRQAEYRCWLCIAVRGDLQRIGKRILPQRRGWEKSSRQQPRLAGFLSFDPSSAFFAPMLLAVAFALMLAVQRTRDTNASRQRGFNFHRRLMGSTSPAHEECQRVDAGRDHNTKTTFRNFLRSRASGCRSLTEVRCLPVQSDPGRRVSPHRNRPPP